MLSKVQIISFLAAMPVFLLFPFILFFLYNIIDFEQLKLFYFSIATFYLILFLIYGLRQKKFLGLWIFVFTILFFFIFLPWGFNLTDEGYSIDLAYFSDDSIKDPFYFPISGGYILFGFWLKAIKNPYLMWSRAFFPLLAACTVWISYQAWNIFFDLKRDFYFGLVIFFALATLYAYYVNFTVVYDQVPFLFLSLSLLFFFMFLKHKSLLMIYLSSFFLGYAFFSRFSMFVAVLFYLILILFFIEKKFFFIYLSLLGGFFSSVALFKILGGNLKLFFQYSWLTLTGVSSEKICILTSDSHTASGLLNLLLLEINGIIFYIFVLSILILLVNFLVKDKFHPFAVNLFIVFAGILFVYFYRRYYPLPDFVYLPLAFGLIMFFLFYEEKIIAGDFKNLIIGIYVLIISLLSFLGSNVGIRKIFFSGALLTFFPFILGYFGKKENWRMAIIVFSFLMIFASITYKTQKVYIDGQIKNLTAEFSAEPLKGIFSYPQKVKIIDQAYKELKKYELDGKYMIINKGLIFPYLLDSKPYFICWHVSSRKFKENFETARQPEYLLFFAKQTSYNGWYLDRFKRLCEDENLQNMQNLYSFILKEYKSCFVVQNFIELKCLKN